MNFTSFAHADNSTYSSSVLISVAFLWVFDAYVTSVPPSVATKPLTLFLVSLYVAQFKPHNINDFRKLGFLMMMPLVYLTFRYQIKRPNVSLYYVPG